MTQSGHCPTVNTDDLETQMFDKIKRMLHSLIRRTGYDIHRIYDPVQHFRTDFYLRHSARRLEHLASLRIPVEGMSVLEVGAGIGDHSHYYIDRECDVTITEVRAEGLRYLEKRYPNCRVRLLDMESPSNVEGSPFDVVHCYGLLYHLSNPKQALSFLSKNTTGMLFLETRVSFGDDKEINLAAEEKSNPLQAYSGTGCWPTRPWVFKELQHFFKYVYIPTTQPNHEEFPLDWTNAEKHKAYCQRAIFIASHEPLESEQLTTSLILRQTRHY